MEIRNDLTKLKVHSNFSKKTGKKTMNSDLKEPWIQKRRKSNHEQFICVQIDFESTKIQTCRIYVKVSFCIWGLIYVDSLNSFLGFAFDTSSTTLVPSSTLCYYRHTEITQWLSYLTGNTIIDGCLWNIYYHFGSTLK